MIRKIAKDRPTHDMKIDSEETPPSADPTDQDFNVDGLKEAEQVETENVDVKVRKLNHVNPEMVARLSEALKQDWPKLATKLGYTAEEIGFFQGKTTQYEQCKSMLEIWAEEDEDASVENLAYILEGLGFTEALAALKT